MRTNIELLALSRVHPEPYVSPAYTKDFRVITDDPARPNKLMRVNREVLDLITAYHVCDRQGNRPACEQHVIDLAGLLMTSGMNHSEFASFWAMLDVSYSAFKAMSAQARIGFLQEAVPAYIRERHAMYQTHGYTPTTLQVKADSFAHKRSGSLARNKVVGQFLAAGIENHRDVQARNDPPAVYHFLPDGGQRLLFQQHLRRWNADFLWGKRYDGKLPDFAFVVGKRFYVVEHKHTKEGGGGQNQTLVQIADFVEQHEASSDVVYVAYLDGVLFNHIFETSGSRGKGPAQRVRIESALTANPQSFYVNTVGFDALLADALAELAN